MPIYKEIDEEVVKVVDIFEGEPLSISYESDLLELEEIEKNAKPTNAFYLPELQLGRLSIVVGTSNSGKTYWSLGTALSLAREGYMVQYISTEETKLEVVANIRDNFIEKTDEELNRIAIHYKPTIKEEHIKIGLLELMKKYPDTQVIMIDYLRTDWTDIQSDAYKSIMEGMLTEIRTFFDSHPQVAIIATIQANAELYKAQDPIAELVANPSKLGVMIDGGLATYRRAHGVAVLLNNIKTNTRKLLVLKGKGRNYNMVGQTLTYEVREKFAISYIRDAFGSAIKTAQDIMKEHGIEFIENGKIHKKKTEGDDI